MKLREVHVDRYGPLRETLQFGDAHVVYGPNESGKTLLVESLLRSLTGDRRVAGSRIDERPEGYVVLDGEGGRFDLADGETLLDRYAERYNFELTPAGFRNVFVVSDGDLRLLDEREFYRRVTDRVVGIWTGDIETVRDRALERGRLTRGDRALAAGRDDAAEQHDLATDLLADVEAYLDEADAAELDAAELACYEAARQRRDAEAEVEALEAAKAREDYEQLVKTKGSLERSLDERAELPDERELDELAERLDELATGSEDELQRRAAWYRRATLAALLAGVVAGAAPLGLGIREPRLVAAGPAAFGVVALVALAAYRSASNAVVRLERDREAIVERASEVGIDAYDPPAVRGAIADYREEHDNHAEVIRGNTEVLRQWLDIDAEAPREVVVEAGDALEARRAEIDFGADREFTEETLEDARERADEAAERDCVGVRSPVRHRNCPLVDGAVERCVEAVDADLDPREQRAEGGCDGDDGHGDAAGLRRVAADERDTNPERIVHCHRQRVSIEVWRVQQCEREQRDGGGRGDHASSDQQYRGERENDGGADADAPAKRCDGEQRRLLAAYVAVDESVPKVCDEQGESDSHGVEHGEDEIERRRGSERGTVGGHPDCGEHKRRSDVREQAAERAEVLPRRCHTRRFRAVGDKCDASSWRPCGVDLARRPAQTILYTAGIAPYRGLKRANTDMRQSKQLMSR